MEVKKNRLKGQKETLRTYLARVYHKLAKEFKDLMKQHFRHITYGTKKDSETYKKSFPVSFKRYFFYLFFFFKYNTLYRFSFIHIAKFSSYVRCIDLVLFITVKFSSCIYAILSCAKCMYALVLYGQSLFPLYTESE